MNQTSGNFAYDLIGNLVKDKAMQVSTMSWTAYHKREKVVKEDGTTITYRYDAMNNRIYKKAEGNGVTETTHYLRDGTGNTLAIYKNGQLEELNIYGSSRLGTYNGKTAAGKRTLGNKRYELSNHLGNALVVITDNKLGKDNDNDFIADTYIAMVVSERDYLAFGAVMHKRSSENEDYTYSFNGKELDKSTGWQDYGFRDYNPVYKRFDRVDPLTQKYPELTPYQFASNTPIWADDLDGLEARKRHKGVRLWIDNILTNIRNRRECKLRPPKQKGKRASRTSFQEKTVILSEIRKIDVEERDDRSTEQTVNATRGSRIYIELFNDYKIVDQLLVEDASKGGGNSTDPSNNTTSDDIYSTPIEPDGKTTTPCPSSAFLWLSLVFNE